MMCGEEEVEEEEEVEVEEEQELEVEEEEAGGWQTCEGARSLLL